MVLPPISSVCFNNRYIARISTIHFSNTLRLVYYSRNHPLIILTMPRIVVILYYMTTMPPDIT
jgi:hypothetical protein